MNSITFSTTACTAPAAPAPILSMVQSRTGRPSPAEPVTDRTVTDRTVTNRTVTDRIAGVVRTLATWSPMSVSSTPSAQVTSNLSPGDRLGERR